MAAARAVSKTLPGYRAAIDAASKSRFFSSRGGDRDSDWQPSDKNPSPQRKSAGGDELWQSLLKEPTKKSSSWESSSDEKRSSNSRGSGGGDDLDLEKLLSEHPSRQQKGAAMWQSLLKEPSKGTSVKWDFLPDLMEGYSKRSQGRSPPSPPSSSSTSYRALRDSGIDFLKEDYNRPSPPPPPPPKESPSEEPEFGLQSLLHAASFKLIKDTLTSKSPSDADKKVVGDTLGMDASHFFSVTSQTKELDSRSLSEVEKGAFQGSFGGSRLESKTFTYEELGEKLRKSRPPKEQILSSATGLSFGELRKRIQNFSEEEYDTQKQEFRELKESLQELRPFRQSDARKQLTYAELAFVNLSGVKLNSQTRIEYKPPNDDLLTKYYSESQLSSKERMKLIIKKLKEEFRVHEYDTGSPQVQIAILTARINNLNRHMREGPNARRDKHSKKGLNDMVQYRKRLLRYLRRRDWPVYCNVLTKLKLDDIIREKRH